MLAYEDHHYTPAEYFAFEEKAAYKSEYRQGRIVAMAGTSLNHNRIAGNAYTALNNVLAGKACETFIGDVRLWIEKKELYTYPDVMVVCGPPEFAAGRTDTLTNPKVIIEVLSESTESYDRGDKFHAYWTLAAFAEYVLIDQYRVQVEYFRRIDEKIWEINILTRPDETLVLKSVGVKIPLQDLYRHVAWEE